MGGVILSCYILSTSKTIYIHLHTSYIRCYFQLWVGDLDKNHLIHFLTSSSASGTSLILSCYPIIISQVYSHLLLSNFLTLTKGPTESFSFLFFFLESLKIIMGFPEL